MTGGRHSPRPAMRHLAALSLPWWLAACGDLHVKSIRSPQVVPAAFAGEWTGTWMSTDPAATGAIAVRVQEFAGEPVVHVEFQNPCIEPRSYELVLSGSTIELRAGADTVLAGALVEPQRLVGTYHCPLESGTWEATWQRDLPELADLGGIWTGTLAVPGQVTRPFELALEQDVDGGELRLTGLLDLGDVWPSLLVVRGPVAFRDDGFDLALQTLSGNSPGLLLAGSGDREPLQVESGLLLTIGSPVLPFSNGVFTISWQGR